MKLALVSMCKGRDIKPPLGLVTLATYLKKYLGFNDTIIVDSNFCDPLDEIKRIKPDLIGITAMTNEYEGTIVFAEEIKKSMDVPIILGGVHISTLPQSFKEVFDIGIVGEGEQTLLELVSLFINERKFEKSKIKEIQGIIYYDEGKKVLTEKRELIDPLDKIPFPDRSFISRKYFEPHFTMSLATLVREATILTSRGCPYNCAFCSTSHFWKITRFHSARHIVDEIKDCVEKYNVNHFDVWDDLFSVKRDRLREIAHLLKEEGLLGKITISCLVRANTLDDEMCGLLKAINVKALNFGFESGNDRVVKFLKGPSTSAEINRKAILTAKKHGFRVAGSLIMGSPTETIEEMKDTLRFIDYAYKNGVNTMYSFVMTPFPGTKIWEIAKLRGKVSDDMWDDLEKLRKRDPFNMLNEAEAWKNPLLLDDTIKKEDFIRVFLEGRKRLGRFRFRFMKEAFLSNPLGTMRYSLGHLDQLKDTIKGILRGNK